MTTPTVTEIAIALAPVEPDDFIDGLEPVRDAPTPLPARTATAVPLRTAA